MAVGSGALRSLAARWWLALVLCTIGFQSLGFVHGIAHGSPAQEPEARHAHDHDHDGESAAGWLDRLFPDHATEQCRLLDALGQPGPSAAAAPLQAPPLAGAIAWAIPAGVVPARRGDLFQARAPPFSR